ALTSFTTFTVTQNSYDGSEWWGTIKFTNNGPPPSANYKVEFDIPSGRHCTADFVPPGATLSPLTGSGSSAHTISNHCIFTWTNTTPLGAGASKTFNYSTDSQSFSSASNLVVSDTVTGAPACKTFALNQNSYDGPDMWGTIRFTNSGPSSSANYQVEFDVPSGKHCTNEPESVPPGATLTPLVGSGPTAQTASNHCIFTWTN